VRRVESGGDTPANRLCTFVSILGGDNMEYLRGHAQLLEMMSVREFTPVSLPAMVMEWEDVNDQDRDRDRNEAGQADFLALCLESRLALDPSSPT
jgi:hypothetical protein